MGGVRGCAGCQSEGEKAHHPRRHDSSAAVEPTAPTQAMSLCLVCIHSDSLLGMGFSIFSGKAHSIRGLTETI